MTNEEKKSYKSSKKRRKQAVIAAETGRIVPIDSGRKKAVLIGGIAFLFLVAAISAVGGYYVYSDSHTESEKEAKTQNKMLLRVVNRSNPLDSSYTPVLTEAAGVRVCEDIADDLGEMLEAAAKSGIELKCISGYISYEEQDALYSAKLEEIKKLSDLSEVRAQSEAAKLVPRAGENEAQTGLLVDFDTNDERAETFLKRDCVKYGFVRRYTEEKEDITGIKSSRSLYRYVSKEHAVKMRSFGMCLEEYADYLSVQSADNK